MTKAQIVDGRFLMRKETEFQEKEKEKEVRENAKAKAAKARKKAQNDSVVERGKAKAAVVAGESSKFAIRKGKEVIYDLLLCIFAYPNRDGHSSVGGPSLSNILFYAVAYLIFSL